jgi:hypothetical protein
MLLISKAPFTYVEERRPVRELRGSAQRDERALHRFRAGLKPAVGAEGAPECDCFHGNMNKKLTKCTG